MARRGRDEGDGPQPQRPQDVGIRPGGNRLGELLVEAQIVPPDQVVAALTEAQRGQGPPMLLGQRLIEKGVLDERGLAWGLARQQRLDFVDLREFQADPAAVQMMPEETARRFTATPLAVQGDRLIVAIAAPSRGLIQELQEETGMRIAVRVAAKSDILFAINNNYKALSAVGSQIRAFEEDHVQARNTQNAIADALALGDEDAPVVQVVHLIITQALRDRSSDIHIEPHPERVRVRYRIDGALHDVVDLPAAMGPVVVSRIKIMAGMNIVEKRRPQDGQISMDIEGRSVDIRVSTTSVVDGEKVVMRLLDKSRPLYRLAQLGMPDHMSTLYTSILKAPFGMVICAGPTGSGKTTTLYGSLAEINTPERNVMTVEDPVEYRVNTINQIQINDTAGVSFANALRSILRQDPDVILLGEIRDEETARIAIQAALTGHFVLSSVHATDAASALHRLLDMGIEPFLVASSLTAVLSQRLLRRICQHCKGPYRPSAEEMALLQAIGGHPPAQGFVRGHGCNLCAHTGYLERIGVYEMMLVTETVKELTVARAAHEEIRRAARQEGMRTLQEEAARLVEGGMTTLAEVLRTIYVVGG